MLKNIDELNPITNARIAHVKIPPHEQTEALREKTFWEMYLETLRDINKSTIHSLTNSLLDTQSQAFTSEYISFFDETTLDQIEFDDLNSNPFSIINKSSKKRMAFSNRYTTNEIRGARLRQLIEESRKSEPTLTLGNLLERVIKEPTLSDTHRYFISSPISENLDEKTRSILIKTSRQALLMLSKRDELDETSLKAVFDQQYEYFHESHESIKSLQNQIFSTTAILEKSLKEALEKRNNLTKSDDHLEEIIRQLRAAIQAGYDLMPDFNQNETISYSSDYLFRINTYTETAITLSNNPNLKKLSLSSYVGITMLALGFLAIAMCATAIFFPPAAVFLSHVLLHGIMSSAVIEGALAATGVVAASAGIGFFREGKKFQAQDLMNSLKLSIQSTELGITGAV